MEAKHISAVKTSTTEKLIILLNYRGCPGLTDITLPVCQSYLLYKGPRIDGESLKVSDGS